MKTLKVLIILLVTVSLSVSLQGQENKKSKKADSAPKTESFKVSGNCGMCKERIEKTAKAEGAGSASWDSKTKMLTVTYDPSKTSVDALSQKIASVGHDTEKYRAPDDVYSKLPGCCHYERVK